MSKKKKNYSFDASKKTNRAKKTTDKKKSTRERMFALLAKHPEGLSREQFVKLGIKSGIRKTGREELELQTPLFSSTYLGSDRFYTYRLTDAGKLEAAKLGRNDLLELPDDWLLPELLPNDDLETLEGTAGIRQHIYRERSPALVRQKKAQAKDLKCEACGFDFLKEYGERGEGFIECHHDIPISESGKGRKTKLSELSLVCSNCHRIIHRTRPWISVAELRKLVQQYR